MTISRRAFVRAASLPLVWAGSRQAPPPREPTARQLVERIRAGLGVEWREKTVDGFKAGSPEAVVTGVAVATAARQDVLRRASAAGLNLVVAQEPTFYGPNDEPGNRGSDPVYLAKKAFIEQHGLVVWRFSDHWSRRDPDPRITALAEALSWSTGAVSGKPGIYRIPDTTVEALVAHVRKSLPIRGGLRLTGARDMRVQTVLLAPGTTDLAATVERLPDADVVLAGEPREWEVVPYVLDSREAGAAKALIAIGRLVSEEPGTQACAAWIRSLLPGVRVEAFPIADPFWSPAS